MNPHLNRLGEAVLMKEHNMNNSEMRKTNFYSFTSSNCRTTHAIVNRITRLFEIFEGGAVQFKAFLGVFRHL